MKKNMNTTRLQVTEVDKFVRVTAKIKGGFNLKFNWVALVAV